MESIVSLTRNIVGRCISLEVIARVQANANCDTTSFFFQSAFVIPPQGRNKLIHQLSMLENILCFAFTIMRRYRGMVQYSFP